MRIKTTDGTQWGDTPIDNSIHAPLKSADGSVHLTPHPEDSNCYLLTITQKRRANLLLALTPKDCDDLGELLESGSTAGFWGWDEFDVLTAIYHENGKIYLHSPDYGPHWSLIDTPKVIDLLYEATT